MPASRGQQQQQKKKNVRIAKRMAERKACSLFFLFAHLCEKYTRKNRNFHSARKKNSIASTFCMRHHQHHQYATLCV